MKHRRGGAKIEPIIAMIALVFLGIWLVVWRPGTGAGAEIREGARVVKLQVGQVRGFVVALEESDGQWTFRLLRRDHVSPTLTEDQFRAQFGDDVTEQLKAGTNLLFRALNITGWPSLVWVGIGLLGQLIFSFRFIIQWIASERAKKSVIPEVFWWISLFGGMSLFLYFVWRQDLIGVLGQSTGIVIYGRNIRLVHKERRRAARELVDQADPA